jgi:hypothetical protein
MPEDYIATANSSLHKWCKTPSDTLEWDVLADGESINSGMPDIASYETVAEVDYDNITSLGDLFFKHVMPDITGHARHHWSCQTV